MKYFLLFLHPRGYIITELSRYVKEKGKEYGLTQVDLSLKSGVGLRFVRKLEQGKGTLLRVYNNPTRSTFEQSKIWICYTNALSLHYKMV